MAPLFPSTSQDADAPGRIAIARVVPADGYLLDTAEAAVSITAVTEGWLRDNFGGGTYELTLYSQRGEQLGTRRLKIAGTPAPKSEVETRAQQFRDEEARAEGATAVQARMFREHLELLKADAQAQRDRARMELELQMRRMSAEADERENRERARHEREMERERERATERERRDKEAIAAQVTQQQQFMLAIQAMNKEQSALMMTVLQSQNSKTDPLEAAAKINALVESRLELQQGDPVARQTEQMWGLVSKGMDLVGREQAAPTNPPAQGPAAQSPSAQGAPVRRTQPAGNGAQEDLPLPQVLKQRLTSIAKKISEQGGDFLEILKGIEEGELAIVPADEYLEGQEALNQLESGEQDPEPLERAKAAAMANRERPHRARANGPAMAPGDGRDGKPGASATSREPDASQGDSPEGPAESGASGAGV